MLTTQLKNQNPLDPLDTNQFTQQLVQFAQVEQQLKSNDQLSTLVALQKSVQSTQALGYVGQTVAIDGQTSTPCQRQRRLELQFAEARFRHHQHPQFGRRHRVYSGAYSLNSGIQNFVWDGRNNSGVTQADGDYKMTITAKDASGQSVAVSTEIQGVVNSVDMTKTRRSCRSTTPNTRSTRSSAWCATRRS